MWAVVSQQYTLDHEFFDIDFDNCVLLTNEHIHFNKLIEDDMIFNSKWIADSIARYEAKKRKRVEQQKNFEAKRRIRLAYPFD